MHPILRRLIYILLAVVLFVSLLVALGVATAQMVLARPGMCGPSGPLIDSLYTKYRENQVGVPVYVQETGNWRLFYANLRMLDGRGFRSSWTIIELGSRGVACIIAAGKRLPPPVIMAILERGRA